MKKEELIIAEVKSSHLKILEMINNLSESKYTADKLMNTYITILLKTISLQVFTDNNGDINTEASNCLFDNLINDIYSSTSV